MTHPAPPLAALFELTHRCPLQCAYCSNPLALTPPAQELTTAQWQDAIRQLQALGVLQVHFSGGEPAARNDLETLVETAHRSDLYTNLITSGVTLKEARIDRLAGAGLDHIQLSIQDTDEAQADAMAGVKGALARKAAAARAIRAAGLPLTVNCVIQRRNVARVAAMIDWALEAGARRIEIAHVQYYGWAIPNRAALLPPREAVDRALAVIEDARERLKGIIAIDHVIPDYYAARPKACMGGWGRQFLVIDPAGDVLPCHAAKTIPDLRFDNVRQRDLASIWNEGEAFQRFRGTAWMPQPCRSCERKEVDWGGCRCQALKIAGNAAATDPACALSPAHARLQALAGVTDLAPSPLLYRRYI
ncbi:MAG: pyrroloquinoline quinone biosynthesis protein PqqE [Alphaproteobacteria bacterium]|nr:pyrroloquinoline quinone biosynthesis protein PqqE [Alphaproteobacteria bacterium]